MMIQHKSEDTKNLIRTNYAIDLFFMCMVLLVTIGVFVPFSPSMPWESLDPSWAYGLNEAVAQGFSFGKDIIFTFGPYASIYTRNYHPATDNLMLFGSLYLAISFAIAVYLNFKSSPGYLKFAFLFILSTVIHSPDALLFFYTMLVGVSFYRLSSSLEKKDKISVGEITLNLVLLAPFGLLPLIKGTMLIASTVVYLLAIALLIRAGKWRICVLAFIISPIALIVFWLLSGQPFFGLIDYFSGLLPIMSGYTEAMASYRHPEEYIAYLIAAATILLFLNREIQASAYNKLVLLLIFSLLFFLAFKAGFVRHDGHAMVAATLILLAAFLASTLLTTQKAIMSVFFVSLITWTYIDAAYVNTSTQSIRKNIKNIYISYKDGLMQRIKKPDALRQQFEARLAELNRRGGIPKLDGSVDIYSYDQSYLIASGNKWNPRPVFQSYSVYTKELSELNKLHLLSDNRPKNIIIKAQPIDGRLPSLEDGASWPVLLTSYKPVSFLNGYLYLKSREDAIKLLKEPRKIEHGIYSLGDQIDLPNSEGVIFAKINIKKSFLGNIANILFKPSPLTIKLTLHNGQIRQYRLISEMAQAGFVVSPLIENTEELGLLFSNAIFLEDKAIKSIEIIAPRFSMLWKDSFEISFFKLDTKESPEFIEKIGFSMPREVSNMNKSFDSRCYGSIDVVNGASPAAGPIIAKAFINVQGWLAASVEPPSVPDTVYLVLSSADDKIYFIDTKRTRRQDVGDYFKKSDLNHSGFNTISNVSNLSGKFNLGLAYRSGNEIFICPQFNIPVILKRK